MKEKINKIKIGKAAKCTRAFSVVMVVAMVTVGFLGVVSTIGIMKVSADPSGIKGIDVSHWQESINWNSVAGADYKFAFCKASEGVSYTDPKFTTNMNNGKSAGLLMGAYHFATPYTNGVNDANDEADYFVQVAGNYIEDSWLRPVLDLEQTGGVSWSTLSSWTDAWMQRVKTKTGVEPILYINSYYSNNLDSSLTKYNLWIAHYGVNSPNTGKWSTWDFWQYTSEGSVPGISGNVDLDVFNGDMSRLNSFVIISIGEAVDNTELSWTTGGNANWFGQTTTYYYGNDAAQSGAIGHSQSTYIQTTVTGPGTLTFYWKVSSESGYDFLRFYIDGIEQSGRISGTTDWQQKIFSIASGSHTLKWAYTKDGSVSEGSDCGWVDKVEFVSSGILITSQSGSLSGTGASYTFSVSGYSQVTVVMAGNEAADFDLYAKWGSAPTTSSYDARGYSSTSLEYFTTSGSETVYIMVRSYSGSGNWKCWVISGSPSANSGRNTGSLSDSGDTATYSLSGGGIGYAFNSGPDSSDFDLYIKWNSAPTTSDYDARGYSSWSQEIAGPVSGSGTLYFMVRSYSGSGGYATIAMIF